MQAIGAVFDIKNLFARSFHLMPNAPTVDEKTPIKAELIAFIASSLVCDSATLVVSPLSGDASFRRYFRVIFKDGGPVEGSCIRHEGTSWIAVDAPPATEKNAEFVAIANALGAGRVAVPEVIAADLQRGFLLLSDLGDTVLLDVLNADNVDDHYRHATDLLITMQQISTPSARLGSYSRQLLWQEMELFPQWFVQGLLQRPIETEERRLLDRSFGLLVSSALEQPQVFVHRDFHSRNLMLVSDEQLATIDFQDAVSGPVTYDLVSLLRDCYVVWPQHRVQAWMNLYCAKAQAAGVLRSVDIRQFQRWFDWMGLQRHIKVLGIFARLYLRDGKSRYLRDLPTVIDYTLDVARRYPQLAGFVEWFETALIPAINDQPWSRKA